MNLEPIVMDPHAARRAFLQYRDAFRKTWSAQDQEIMRGYRALSQGKQLISLSQAIKAGGQTDVAYKSWDGTKTLLCAMPKLACVRAHAKICHARFTRDGAGRFSETKWPSPKAVHNVRKFHAGTIDVGAHHSQQDAKAIVPLVPPQFRPPHSLENYHILFEAEWQIDQPPPPPTDPALLKHIGGDLYAVLAVWDLTEVERHVLALFNRGA